MVMGQLIIFVYEYCLSKVFLLSLSPVEQSVVVNLHGWNGELSISNEAYELADNLNVKLLTKDEFYGFVREIKKSKCNC